MLRGAIEGVTHDAIFGWLYSPEIPLRGRTVLAFLDGRCIGSGRIEVFRQDLKDARLGDGFCGFHFGLTYPGRAEPGRVVVKLEASDAVLLQSGNRVRPDADAGRGCMPLRQSYGFFTHAGVTMAH